MQPGSSPSEPRASTSIAFRKRSRPSGLTRTFTHSAIIGSSLQRLSCPSLPQAGARVDPEIDPAADRVPLRRDRDGLADGVQIAPALGEAALALERGAAAVPVHQLHRLPRTVAGIGR